MNLSRRDAVRLFRERDERRHGSRSTLVALGDDFSEGVDLAFTVGHRAPPVALS
jgi:hypothetical protein